MEAMQGQPVEEGINATGSAVGACTAVMDWYQPRGDAERDHLGGDLNNIASRGVRTLTFFRSCRREAQRVACIVYPYVGPRSCWPYHASSSLRLVRRGATD